MQSSLLLNQFTQVDFSYIDNEGNIKGMSINVSAVVAGEITGDEHVVVDFSKAKKQIKSTLDELVDHRLWIINGWSKVKTITDVIEDKRVIITTDELVVELPTDAIVQINVAEGTESTLNNIVIQSALSTLVSTVTKWNVQIMIDNQFHVIAMQEGSNTAGFTYVHGLKDSSSFGCQNIAHGHLSLITGRLPQEVLQEVASLLNDKVLANVANKGEKYDIEYTTEQRGYFGLSLTNKDLILWMDTETTCEYIAKFIGDKIKTGYPEIENGMFYISEGLTKGVIQEL